jgi:glycerol-3-phosphate dehydrogenase (NAD(P)+)
MSIAILGAGAFGTALAVTLSANAPVTLWARSEKQALLLQKERQNAQYLQGVTLDQSITVTADISAVSAHDIILLAVPMQQLRQVLKDHASAFVGKRLVACCKGVELGTHMGPVEIMRAELPEAYHAMLTGPSFAGDIAKGLPTALTLACSDEAIARMLQESLTTETIRLYTTTDVIGAELGGALKNVMAIACGAVIGAGLGESARAALMTRGFAEMTRLAVSRGAEERTLSGLSGFGDLVLTCASAQSRNFRMGLALGTGSGEVPQSTVEGVATARSVAAYAFENGLDLPIIQTVAALVDGTTSVSDAMAALLSRPLKPE